MKITITYHLIWQLDFAEKYKLTKCRKLFNCQTGRLIEQRSNGGSIGYWINRKFYTIDNLKKHFVKIPKKEYCPF